MRVVAIAIALLVAAGCGADMSETETIDNAETEVQALTVVTLVFSDGRLVIDQEERFTFVTHDGEVLLAEGTFEDLEETVPLAARRYHRMTAFYQMSQMSQMRPIDASLDPELLPPSQRF